MSWDVIMLKLPEHIQSVSEIADDYDEVLGPLDWVRSIIKEVAPDVNLRDPSLGVLIRDEYSIEFSIGKEDPCKSLSLHVRGDDSAVSIIQELCSKTRWRAIDCSDSQLIDFHNDPARGLRGWRDYRDSVIPDAPKCGVVQSLSDGSMVVCDGLQQTHEEKRKWWQFWK